MDKFESLSKFIDAVIQNNDKAAAEAFQAYSVVKSREILGTNKQTTELKEWAVQLMEFIGDDSPIKLYGDDILVKGKKVGHIQQDLNDMDGGINFVSVDGKFSKEFNSIQELYQFLIDKFGIKE